MNIITLGNRANYQEIWQSMREFTDARDSETPDQIWIVEHEPVFTLGQAGKPEHILNPKNIPVIQTDRGGQVTYHGPGQIVLYLLFDLHRLNITIRELVSKIESAIINFLSLYNISAELKPNAPGVYVNGAKICALGLRVRKGCTYHGLSFNYDMDLSPFQLINPCGFQNLPITQLRDCVTNTALNRANVTQQIITQLTKVLDVEYAY